MDGFSKDSSGVNLETRDSYNGLSEYDKDIRKKFNICMYSSCEKEHNP
jgi:hypothetical protein